MYTAVSKVRVVLTVVVVFLMDNVVGRIGRQNGVDNSRVLQTQSEPRLFKLATIFEGTWNSASGQNKQFGEYDHNTGWTRCQFSSAARNNSKYFIIEVVNGVTYP